VNAKWMQWLRRIVQGAVLLLFLLLFWEAQTSLSEDPKRSLQLFFLLDPLVLIATWLAAHAVPALLLFSLITLGATAILGRVFCGWVCPLGTVHNMASWLRRKAGRATAKLGAWSGWQRAKYYLLAGLIVMAVFGASWIGVFDPFSMLYRSMVTALYPATQYAVEDGATAIYVGDPHVGPLHLKDATEPAYKFLRSHVFLADRTAFLSGSVLFFIFVVAVALNFVRPRFWCRYICPLGALLGLFARRALLRLTNEPHICTNCTRCAAVCPAAAQPQKPGEWLPTECFGCWNCVHVCEAQSVSFGFGSPFRRASAGKLDISKRALLASMAGGIGGMLMFRLTPHAQAKTFNPALIRPPGALKEREFLARCIQCGLCMNVCPTNALQPTFAEAGIEGLWTPRLVPRIGYCEYECNRCGQACPTGAIEPLSLDAKKKTVIGLASFDTTRCLPYAYGQNCIVCEEHCPLPKKAIYTVDTEVTLRDGSTRTIRQPRVDASVCIGCGICENVCPFEDRPAIRVTSANETRHLDNQPILQGLEGFDLGGPQDVYGATDPYGGAADPYK